MILGNSLSGSALLAGFLLDSFLLDSFLLDSFLLGSVLMGRSLKADWNRRCPGDLHRISLFGLIEQGPAQFDAGVPMFAGVNGRR